MKASALKSMEPGDWMIGGSRDAEGERAHGFGPQDAAHVAAIAYNAAAVMFEGSTQREFAQRLAGVFLSELLDVIEAKSEIRGH